MKFLKYTVPVASLVILAFIIALQVQAYLKSKNQVPTNHPPLAGYIPDTFAGWKVENLDLGPTESIKERSLDLLNLDDFVYRSYKGQTGEFTIYIGYWGPGKEPIRMVSQHTPDRCWVSNGWACTDREFNVSKSIGDIRLQPAQWGIYEIQGFDQHVYFWHIVNGEVKWYAGERLNTHTTLRTVFLDLKNFTLGKKPVQYFVRIVSPESFDKIWELPEFQEVMLSLADLCLAFPENQKKINPGPIGS